jgi:hypothetical protein
MYSKLHCANIVQPQAASLLLHVNNQPQLPKSSSPSHNAFSTQHEAAGCRNNAAMDLRSAAGMPPNFFCQAAAATLERLAVCCLQLQCPQLPLLRTSQRTTATAAAAARFILLRGLLSAIAVPALAAAA